MKLDSTTGYWLVRGDSVSFAIVTSFPLTEIDLEGPSSPEIMTPPPPAPGESYYVGIRPMGYSSVDAVMKVIETASAPVNVYNLGTAEHCDVDESLGWICDRLGVAPRRRYTGGERGWIGDSPFIFLDTAKVRSLGWRPKLTIREAVLKTVDYLGAHPDLFAPHKASA